MRTIPSAFAAIFLVTAGAAMAQDAERPFCTNRPGVNTASCTVEPGRVMVEFSLADWTRNYAGGVRGDGFLFADTLVRVGVTRTGEAQVGWTPLGYSRTRTSAPRLVARDTGTGDIYLAWRQSVSGVNGPVAVQGFVTVPTGSGPLNTGTWTAGVLVPVSFSLTESVSFAATPQVNAAADADGDGRHLFYGSAVGVSFSVADSVGLIAELSAYRDDDPLGDTTEVAASGSAAWQVADEQQVDAQVSLGLNRDTPDLRVIVGLARRF